MKTCVEPNLNRGRGQVGLLKNSVYLAYSTRIEYDFPADYHEVHRIRASTPALGSFEQVGNNRGAFGARLGLVYVEAHELEKMNNRDNGD